MTINSIKTVLGLVCLLLVSCGEDTPLKSKTEVLEDQRTSKGKQMDSLNKMEASNLIQKLNAINYEDSTIQYTYWLQEKIEKNENRPLAFRAMLTDIYKKDSGYVLMLTGFLRENQSQFISQIELTKTQLQKFTRQKTNYSLYIIKPKSITSHSSLSLDVELSDSETPTMTHQLYFNILNIKGTLVDYYIDRTLEDEH